MTIDKDSNSFKEFSAEFKTKLNSALLNKLTEIKKQVASGMIGENHVNETKNNSFKKKILAEAKMRDYTDAKTLSKVANYMSKISTTDIEKLLKKHGNLEVKVVDYFDDKISLKIADDGKGINVYLDVEFADDGMWDDEEPVGGIIIFFDSSGKPKSADYGGYGAYFESSEINGQKTIVEAETNGVKHKKASAADRKKGESYSIVDTKNKEIIAQGLQRKSAKEIAETDPNFVSGSSNFIFDKYINTWN